MLSLENHIKGKCLRFYQCEILLKLTKKDNCHEAEKPKW